MVSLSDSARGSGRLITTERLIKRSTSLISRAVCRVTLFINFGGFYDYYLYSFINCPCCRTI